MSILLLDQLVCPICDNLIRKGQEYYLFPAFVANMNDPICFFNDKAFHKVCLQKHPLANTAMNYADECAEQNRPANRRCLVSGELISDQESDISIILLTSDRNHFLHQFNFVHIDKANLANWIMRDRVVLELVNFQKGNNWQEWNGGDYLAKLIFLLSGN